MSDTQETWVERNRRMRSTPGSATLQVSSSSSSSVTSATAQAAARGIKAKPMPILGYNSQSICDYFDRRPWEVVWRLNCLGLPLLGWYVGLLTDKLVGVSSLDRTQRKRGAQLRCHLVQSGSVALIKSGQAASLRPDLLRNKIWAEELGKLVDAVGSFSDVDAMKIIRSELSDLLPSVKDVPLPEIRSRKNKAKAATKNKVQKMVESDPILSMFEFYNDNRVVASASIGQVYRAKIRKGARLEAAIGKEAAEKWGGKVVAIKVQRPEAEAASSLDMYLLRRAAMWLSMFRGGDLPAVVDQFGMQLFGELDYVREANNCDRFRELYGHWEGVAVPSACTALTRKKVLVMEWVDGTKGPWKEDGIEMVRMGLRCSVDQLMHTGLFHSDPHRGNLLKTPDNDLAFIDFGMMADIDAEDRYGLVGLVIGVQNKDLPLITENLLKLGFLSDTTQLDVLVPRLRQALNVATGGTGKASDMNFAKLQTELDDISREKMLQFSIPPFFTVIVRSLTILEGIALSVDPNFKLVRGAYPYILAQMLSPEGDAQVPAALQKLLVRLLTVEGNGQEIEWGRLRDFLRLSRKAAKSYDDSEEDRGQVGSARRTLNLFFKLFTSKAGLFLKAPLVHELAEAIDGMASIGEANLLRLSRGLIRPLPGGNGPVNTKRMEEVQSFLDVVRAALVVEGDNNMQQGRERLEAMMELLSELAALIQDEKRREEAAPILAEVQSVFQLVAVEVLEIRGKRAVRSLLRV